MADSGRPAGVGVRTEALRSLAVFPIPNDEVAGYQIDLLPVVVHERIRGEGARPESQQSGTVPGLVLRIETAGEDFLFDVFRIPRRRAPARGAHVDRMKFLVSLRHRGLTQRLAASRFPLRANRYLAFRRRGECSDPSRTCGSCAPW